MDDIIAELLDAVEVRATLHDALQTVSSPAADHYEGAEEEQAQGKELPEPTNISTVSISGEDVKSDIPPNADAIADEQVDAKQANDNQAVAKQVGEEQADDKVADEQEDAKQADDKHAFAKQADDKQVFAKHADDKHADDDQSKTKHADDKEEMKAGDQSAAPASSIVDGSSPKELFATLIISSDEDISDDSFQEEVSPRPREAPSVRPVVHKPTREPVVLMDFTVTLPPSLVPPTPWRPGGKSIHQKSRRAKQLPDTHTQTQHHSLSSHLGGGVLNLSEKLLLNEGYRKHMGKWRGFPHDCWTCCGSSEKRCPLPNSALKEIGYEMTDPRGPGDTGAYVIRPQPPPHVSMSLSAAPARSPVPVAQPAPLSGGLSPSKRISASTPSSPKASPRKNLRSSPSKKFSALPHPITPTAASGPHSAHHFDVTAAVARAEVATLVAANAANKVRRNLSPQSRSIPKKTPSPTPLPLPPSTPLPPSHKKKEASPESTSASQPSVIPRHARAVLSSSPVVSSKWTPSLPPSDDGEQLMILEKRVAEIADRCLEGERAQQQTTKLLVKVTLVEEKIGAIEMASEIVARKHHASTSKSIESIQTTLNDQRSQLRTLSTEVAQLQSKERAREKLVRQLSREDKPSPRPIPPPPPFPSPLQTPAPVKPARPAPTKAVPAHTRPPPPPAPAPLPSKARRVDVQAASSVSLPLPTPMPLNKSVQRHDRKKAQVRVAGRSNSSAAVKIDSTFISLSRRSVSAPSRIGPPPQLPTTALPAIASAAPTPLFPLHFSPPAPEKQKPIPAHLKRRLEEAMSRKKIETALSLGDGLGTSALDLSNIPEAAQEDDCDDESALMQLRDGTPFLVQEVDVSGLSEEMTMEGDPDISIEAARLPVAEADRLVAERRLWWSGVMRRRDDALRTGAARA